MVTLTPTVRSCSEFIAKARFKPEATLVAAQSVSRGSTPWSLLQGKYVPIALTWE